MIYGIDDKKLRVKIKPNWLPPFRIEYDGKYVTLFGRDKNFPETMFHNPGDPIEYHTMVLVPVLIEIRNVNPKIIGETKEELLISLKDEKP